MVVTGRRDSKSRARNSLLCSNGFSNDVALMSMDAEPFTESVIDPFFTSDPSALSAWIFPTVIGIVTFVVPLFTRSMLDCSP